MFITKGRKSRQEATAFGRCARHVSGKVGGNRNEMGGGRTH